jgi:hypothetical protein
MKLIDAALAYAVDGRPVFPCGANKQPLVARGFLAASKDPEDIRRWWSRWPDAFIGMPTGPASGVSVLDLDLKKEKDKNGFEAVPDWETRTPVIAMTQSGGAHLYFAAEGSPRNTTDEIAFGVDTRGAGGYVIVPPSPGYTWVNGSDLSNLPSWPDDLRPLPKGEKTKRTKRESAAPGDDPPIDDDSLLAAAVEAMFNGDRLGWDEWNRSGMALWRATDGNEAGRKLWHAYSKKSKKYDEAETDERWDHYFTSPPNELGAGTLFFLADKDSPGWRKEYLKEHFDCDDKGKPYAKSQKNIRTALALLGVTLRHDVFAERSTIEGLEGYSLLDDNAIERLWLLIDERYNFLPPEKFFWVVVSEAARRNSYHPVKNYLASLKWDGEPRVDEWLITYCGAKATPYVRAVGALTLIAAVRRIREPGCKFDEMLILESQQGTEKSMLLELLAANSEWFTDDLPLNSDTKVVIERLRGRWIVEAAELSGMRKADVEHLKSFLSRQKDCARPAFGRKPTELLRQCIIVGTTNHKEYLKDQTGNRRYWPVAVGELKTAVLRSDRDQLWAEAAEREAAGESIRLKRELWKDAAEEQGERTVDDPWVDKLAEALGDREGKILATDVWMLVGLSAGQRTQAHNERLGAAMRTLGWQHDMLRFGGKNPENCYSRGKHKSYGKAEALKRLEIWQKYQFEFEARYANAEDETAYKAAVAAAAAEAAAAEAAAKNTNPGAPKDEPPF